MPHLRTCAAFAILHALTLHAATPPVKPFIDSDRAELVQAVPDLAPIQPAANQDDMETILQAAGNNLHNTLAKLPGLSATEAIHEMRFEDSTGEASRRETFRYVLTQDPFDEVRTDPTTGAPIKNQAHSDFLVTGHFFPYLRYLLPEFRDQSRFRYLGRIITAEHEYLVIAFAQQPAYQGLVWIDSSNHHIARLRVSPLAPTEDLVARTLTTDIVLNDSLLPAKISVHASYPTGQVHSVHRFSEWAPGATTVDSSPEDAWEMLDRGIALSRENKSAEAGELIRKALALNPDMPVAHYHLAAALNASGDATGAEAELREAVKRLPDSGPAHNFLGILIFKHGDVAAAVEEFRSAVRLQPQNAIAHFNLAQALERQGDGKAAQDEYRTASALAPDNPKFKARATNPPAPASTETAIKVDVRQVLVPVVVTNTEGHHVTGLTQADFTVFEDGAEQKISGFSVENIGAFSTTAGAAPPEAPPAATPSPAAHVPTRRTYLICIDSFHSAFGDLVHVREALTKLFRSEQAGDAQYILVAIGPSMQVLQNPTTDPEAILKAIGSKDFQKVFQASRQSSGQMDLQEFRRALDAARDACDHHDPSCEPLKRALPPRAQQIASQDRVEILNFLGQFKSLVQTLSQGKERRSIILVSDGFQLVPGKLTFELTAAYFPEFSSLRLSATERMTELEPILRLAANSNIPIYTIDSRGLYTPSFFDASNGGGTVAQMPAVMGLMNQTDSEAGDVLSEIASATGGTFFRNSNNILNGLERAFADGRQYYMLAYVPSAAKSDGKFHAITVRVRDSKQTVKAKRGYWATAN
jgi:VWFA-related protein